MSNTQKDFEYEEFLRWREARARQHQRIDGPDPNHRGVIDASYVRPAPSEFPKMVYRKNAKDPKGYSTRIIESMEEQNSVIKKGWLVTTKEIHSLLDALAAERNGVQVEVA